MTRTISLVALAVVAAAAPLTTPGARAAKTGAYFVALGDSYSSGEGVEPYDPESASCHRSAGAYPSLAAAEAPAHGWTYRFVACSGATTDDTNRPDAGGQISQVEQLGEGVRLATITIGGNDARFGAMLRRCALGSTPCTEENDHEEAWIENEVRPRLKATYAKLRGASPGARMVVLTYVHIFQTEVHCGREPGMQNAEKAWMRDRTDQLDDMIGEEATAAGLQVLEVRDAFAGHEICTAEPWVNGWGEPGPFHPNAKGHDVLARRLVDFLAR